MVKATDGTTINVGAAIEGNSAPKAQHVNGNGVMPMNPWDFTAPISKSSGSEQMIALEKTLTEIYSRAAKDYKFDVISVDRETLTDISLYFSCIVIVGSYTGIPNKLAYHVLVIEASNNPIPPVNETLANKMTVEVTRLSSDAVAGDVFIRAIDSIIRKKYNTPGMELVYTDSTVIPRDFNFKDSGMLQKIAYHAVLATSSELMASMPGFNDINLQNLVQAMGGNTRSLNIYVNYGRQNIVDITGLPVRSDVRCIFKDNPLNRNNANEINSAEQTITVAEVNGYVDLLWVGGHEENPFIKTMNYQPKFDNYAARFVITDIDNMRAYTPGGLLLAIATTHVLGTDNNYYMAFRPQTVSKKAIDLTDIGALGYENNITGEGFKKIDTKSDSFNTNMLGSLIQTFVKPGISIAIDIPYAGPQTWYMRILLEALVNPKAQEYLINAANTLTNGYMKTHFSGNVFTEATQRIHLGYYVNAQDERRDIRELDYLAIANIVGAKEPQRIADWFNTYYGPDPLSIKLAERKRMIEELTNHGAVFTGYAERVTFNPEFLRALIDGIKSCNFNVTLNSPLNSGDFNNMRGRASYVPGIGNVGGFASPQMFNNASNYGNINLSGNRYI